jgi:7-carboxy-7-deazaguanine synthase (Cx14CxxC type)
MYSVKEIYYTLQGEGQQMGRPAVFLRFSGCNLWSGREKDREKAICRFCDTDFRGVDGIGGAKYTTAQELVKAVSANWPKTKHAISPYVVCTGGEPLLQLDKELIDEFHRHSFEIGVETNGTILAPENIDWICVSPKANSTLKQITGNEIKLVYPQIEKSASPHLFQDMNFDFFFLQPLDDKNAKLNTELSIDYCLKNPQWRLSIQSHKILGLP